MMVIPTSEWSNHMLECANLVYYITQPMHHTKIVLLLEQSCMIPKWANVLHNIDNTRMHIKMVLSRLVLAQSNLLHNTHRARMHTRKDSCATGIDMPNFDMCQWLVYYKIQLVHACM
jgi:hypothetical protein